MKMSKKSYNFLKSVIEIDFKNRKAKYKAHILKVYKLSNFKDFFMRIRWDILHSNNIYKFINDLYNIENLNDDNIDTALKKVFKELKLNSFIENCIKEGTKSYEKN